jgi:hypothetical protein
MEEKEVGAMPAIEQQKNLHHIWSRRARVAEGVGIPSAEFPAREAISDLPGSGELLSEEAREKAERCVSDDREERSETIGVRWNTPKCGKASCSRKRNSAWGILR